MSDLLAESQRVPHLFFRLFNYLCYLIAAILGYRYIFPWFSRKKNWWLIFPVTVGGAFIIGILMAFIGQGIFSNYSISPYNTKPTVSSISLFQHLIARNSIEILNALAIASLGLRIEQFLSFKPIGTWKVMRSFWFSLGIIYFIISLLLSTMTFVGMNTGQMLVFAPQALILSLIMTFSSRIFYEEFLSTEGEYLKKLGGKMSRFLYPNLGFLGLFMFAFDHRFAFGDRWLESGWKLAIVLALVLSVIVALTTIISYWLNLSGVKSKVQLQADLTHKSSELDFLKSQINPHFLFNSLNTIYGLALLEKSPKTAEGVQKLSEMMRFMLNENTKELISLEREIQYIRDYISFQELRINNSENTNLEFNIESDCGGSIAPMLLIPMIENAFKHGISTDKPSRVSISLECSDSEVSLNIQNTNHRTTNKLEDNGGVGLENVRQRLTILYPNKHLFQIFDNPEMFEANMKIQLK